MILCGRYTAASRAAQEHLAAWPLSQAYLQAEACWRSGEIGTAMNMLSQAAPSPVHSPWTVEDRARSSVRQLKLCIVHSLECSGVQHPDDTSESKVPHHQQQTQPDSCPAAEQDTFQLQQSTASAAEEAHQAVLSSCQSRSSPQQGTADIHGDHPATRRCNASSCRRSTGCNKLGEQQPQERPQQQMRDVSSRCKELSAFLKPLQRLQAAAEEAHEDGTLLTKDHEHLLCGQSWLLTCACLA